jgi:hypothetical protein
MHQYNALVRTLEAVSGSSVHRKAAPAKRTAKKVIVKVVAPKEGCHEEKSAG